jgi:hypothetical protein
MQEHYAACGTLKTNRHTKFKTLKNLIANPTHTGFTWTLTTYALKYLLEAENLYGTRTRDYEYVGIELNETGPPKVWYPWNKYIVIQVSQTTANDVRQAILQIAHEVVHVLSPNGQPTTNNLEEGLATYFSKIATDRDTGDTSYAIDSIKPTKYFKPYQLIDKLISSDPDAIKKLRDIEPVLGRISKQTFADAGIVLDEDIIDELIKPMEY